MESSIRLLPPELLCIVFSYLPLSSRLSCRAVSTTWNQIASSQSSLWSGLKLCVRSNHGDVARMLRRSSALFSNLEQITLLREVTPKRKIHPMLSNLPNLSISKVEETKRHTEDILESLLARNRSSEEKSVTKVKTLIVVKGNLTKVAASLLASTIVSGLERVQLEDCGLTGDEANQLLKLLCQGSGSLRHLDLSGNRTMFTNDENTQRMFRTWRHNDLFGFPRFEDFKPDPRENILNFIVNLESVNLSTCSLPKYLLWLMLGAIAREKTCRLRKLDVQWNHIFFTAEEEVQIQRLSQAKNVRILIDNQSLTR